MDTKDMDMNSFADMFSKPQQGQQQDQNSQRPSHANFGMREVNTDLFGPDGKGPAQGQQQQQQQQTTQTQQNQGGVIKDPNAAAAPIATEADDPLKKEKELLDADVDILTGKKKEDASTGATQGTENQQVEIAEMTKYYEERVKQGKLVAIEDVDEKGNKVTFIPKTYDDFDEVLELQVNHKLEQAKKNINESWYEDKSAAWKVVAKYSEMLEDPSQLIPFLEGVRTIQSVQAIDENEIEGAEQIVRVRMEQAGDPEEVIEAQVESLKSADKLISTAKAYKPIIVRQEQEFLANQARQEEQRQQMYMEMVNDIRKKTVENLEKPLFGNQKLKQEEKRAVYDMVANPSKEAGGYKIFNVINDLYTNNDYTTLTQIALLIAHKDAFLNYLKTDAAHAVAAGIQRKLRVADTAQGGSGNDFTEEKVSIARPTGYSRQPRFGREQ